MIVCETADEAVAGVRDRATVLIGGFGMAGAALRRRQRLALA